ncbi:MAG: hypothetical protein JXJ22_00545 [Bacteroidales bacterium]|nr:hypothetical protein [Bacteroidales bacterium]
MKHLICILFFLPAIGLQIIAQPENKYTDDKDFLLLPSETSISQADQNILKTPELKKVKLNFSAGTNFSFYGKNRYSSGTYIAPNLSYTIFPRLKVRVGSILSYENFMGDFSQEMTGGLSETNGFYSFFLYASGEYLVNDRLTFTGSVFKRLTPAPYYQMNPRAMNYRSQDYSVGFNYKITEGLSIGGQVRFSDYNYPFLNPHQQSPAFTNDPTYW